MSPSPPRVATAPRPEGYEFACPVGEWIGRLDLKQWGKNKNLTLYFTDETAGGRYWFSVFAHEAYRARDGQVAFRDEETGTRYKMNTRRNPEGKPVFLGATKLS